MKMPLWNISLKEVLHYDFAGTLQLKSLEGNVSLSLCPELTDICFHYLL